MQQVSNRIHWRASFLGALKLFAQAGRRLPIGVSDPVLCGDSAVELYTGGLWSAADLEVIASDARLHIAELFAVGYRWSGRPRYAAQSLWHPELQIGIDIVEPRETPSRAEQANRLMVAIDLDLPRPTDVVSLKVIGIEDLISQQVGCWLRDGSPSGEFVSKLQALLALGRAGVGGPFGMGYLQRRLARETNGEVVIEVLKSDEDRMQIQTQRTIGLSEMQARISVWCDRSGVPLASLNSKEPGTSTDFMPDYGGGPGRGGRPGLSSARIIPFDLVSKGTPE
jgi:hypothetical protein